MTAKGLSQVWKETGQRKNKFSIRLPEKLEEADKKINKYLPEKLAEDFVMHLGWTLSSGRRLEIK